MKDKFHNPRLGHMYAIFLENCRYCILGTSKFRWQTFADTNSAIENLAYRHFTDLQFGHLADRCFAIHTKKITKGLVFFFVCMAKHLSVKCPNFN